MSFMILFTVFTVPFSNSIFLQLLGDYYSSIVTNVRALIAKNCKQDHSFYKRSCCQRRRYCSKVSIEKGSKKSLFSKVSELGNNIG